MKFRKVKKSLKRGMVEKALRNGMEKRCRLYFGRCLFYRKTKHGKTITGLFLGPGTSEFPANVGVLFTMVGKSMGWRTLTSGREEVMKLAMDLKKYYA